MDEFETQTFAEEHTVTAADLTGSMPDGRFKDRAATYEIAGGLDRGEVAELVAVRSQLVAMMPGTSTAEGQLEAAIEFSADSEGQLHGENTLGRSTQNWQGNGERQSAFVATTDPDILYTLEAASHDSFTDSPTGTGGGGSDMRADVSYNYRSELGGGPTYDRHNELHSHLGLQVWNTDDQRVRVRHSGTLIWDVIEER